jgi:hypothetical protein
MRGGTLVLGLGILSVGATARRMAPSMSKANLPSKVCVVCNRPFTWRKKWERCWDEVTTCSKRCNSERRSLNRQDRKLDVDDASRELGSMALDSSPKARARRAAAQMTLAPAPVSERASSDETADLDPGGGEGARDERSERKAAKKAAKAARRAVREGRAEPTLGQKPCELCARECDLLIRCAIDSSSTYRMVCGRCWKLPTVAGGVVDGDGSNPHYKYGGLWKNHHRRQ